MGKTTKYTIAGVEFDTTVIGGIGSVAISDNAEIRAEQTSGEVSPRFATKVGAKPVATFSSFNIAAMLGQVGAGGLDIETLSAGLNLYARKYIEASVPAATAVHRKFTATNGIILPRRLSVDHQGDASLDIEALFTSTDGATNPLAIDDTTISVPGVTDAERFTLGPLTLAGQALGDMQSLEIDFGLGAETEGGDSDLWPTFSSIQTWVPTITIVTANVPSIASAVIPPEGIDYTHANTIFYLKKRTNDEDGFELDATAEHVKFTAGGLARVENLFSGSSGNESAQIGIVMHCTFDGTNDPLTVDTASAIT